LQPVPGPSLVVTAIAGLRNRALIAVGYDTLCRRSELVGLRTEDFTFKAGHVTRVLIRRRKNDPFGNGRLGLASASTVGRLRDGVYSKGMDLSAVRENRIATEPLGAFSLNRILKSTAEAAGLPKK
jgi:integrase/recombinase XerD